MKTIVGTVALVVFFYLTQAVANPPRAPREPSTMRFAIVLGVNQPISKNLNVLRYADDDAVAMHSLLIQAGVASVLLVEPDEATTQLHPKVHINGPPTLDSLLAAFELVNNKMTEVMEQGYSTELLFFYSGHGDVDQGEGYVALRDGKLTKTILFNSVLSQSSATYNHVVIDACKSYYLVYDKGPGGYRTDYRYPFDTPQLPTALENTGFILSASSDRNSHEWERFQAGIFSHEVRSGIRGGADVNTDGRITYAELGAFLDSANKSIANDKLRPIFLVKPPGNPVKNLGIPILIWPRSRNELTVDVSYLGHFYLENAQGVRHLDVHPAANQQLTLHLPPERPLFVRKADESIELVIQRRDDPQLSAVAPRPFEIARKGAQHLAFEELFAQPFSSGNVREFTEEFRDQTQREQQITQELVFTKKRRKVVKSVALGTALGATALGLGATFWSLERRLEADEAAHRDVDRINTTIRRINTGATICYSLAAVAAATWISLHFGATDEEESPGVTVTPSFTDDGVGLSIMGRFGQ